MFSDIPGNVTIVEVGPRDGLQNESTPIDTSEKIEFINRLSKTGLKKIEAASFVSAKWVPQMASSDLVMQGINRIDDVSYSALTPNMRGFEAAVENGCSEVAIFGAASESFSQKNINCGINESIQRFAPILNEALKLNIPVRGYVSCVLGCPYEGLIEPNEVLDVAKQMLDLGCYEVSLGDTIGVGTPIKTSKLLEKCLKDIPSSKLAGHFHDTYGQALANVLTALNFGINTFDSSVAGLGGCPYARGASGNLATEDLVYMLENMGISTGVKLSELADIGQWISTTLSRTNMSKVGSALTSQSPNNC